MNEILEQDINNIIKSSIIEWNLLKGKTIYISGASGIIGQFLVTVLLEANKRLNLRLQVVASVRDIKKTKSKYGSRIYDKALKLYKNDVTKEIKYSGKADYIIHCASSTSSRFFVENPVETLNTAFIGTNNLIRFALKKNSRSIVYLSSMEVYGTVTSSGEITEKDLGSLDIMTSRSSYPMGKRASESLCFAYFQEYKVPVKIVRLAQIVNSCTEYTDPHLYAHIARSIIERRDLVLNTSGNTIQSFCYITDAITAILSVMLKGADGEAYNVSSSSIKIKDLVSDLCKKYGISLKFDINNTNLYPAETNLTLSTEKLEQLGWKASVSPAQMWSNLISGFYMNINQSNKHKSFNINGIFSIKNNEYGYKIITIAGIKIKINLLKLFNKTYNRLPISASKIVFSNFNGKGYGCNPKYIAEEIIKRGYPYDLVWLVDNVSKEIKNFPPEIRLVKRNSRQALKELSTAKIWIDNYRKHIFYNKGLRKKSGQYYIQTWHGSLGIKKLDADVKYLNNACNQAWVEKAKYGSSCIDYLITNSKWEDDVLAKALWYKKEKKQFGHPRNDLFFQDNKDILKKIRGYYGIKGNKKIVLYVPTFRDDCRIDCYCLDYTRVIAALTKRFGGEWVFIVKFHPRASNYAKYLIASNENVINGTEYTDIQELLVSADAVVTDYSSCIFDFMLSYRPGFIFAIDKEIYDRGLYYPLESAPFPTSCNNDELTNNILNFDEEQYKIKINRFLREKGCIEDGHAAERTADLVERLMADN